MAIWAPAILFMAWMSKFSPAPLVTPAKAGVGLNSASIASQKNTYYTCLNIVNFIDPIPAFAGMTKHGCDMRDDDIKRIIKKPPNGGFLIWEKAFAF